MSDQHYLSSQADSVRGRPVDLGRHHAHEGIAEHQIYGGDHEHHGGLRKYFVVFVVLCVLTGASFLTYSDWWRATCPVHVSWAFMMSVSFAKAMLVILFFMHVKYEANWKYVLTIPAAMMSVFLVLMLVPDVGMRGRMASEEVVEREASPDAGDHRDNTIHAAGDAAPAAGH